MSRSNHSATLGKLRALASHPSTSENERANAIRRIQEIEGRIRAEAKRIEAEIAERGKASEYRSGRDALGSFGKMRKRRVASAEKKSKIHDDWPFGWDGPKAPLEYERAYNRTTSEYVINWKCPGCGGHVTRFVGKRMVIRHDGQPGGVESYLEKFIDGTFNQLCSECWDLWNRK